MNQYSSQTLLSKYGALSKHLHFIAFSTDLTPTRIFTWIQTRAAILSAVVAGLALAGCAMVGPDYARVEPDAPPQWQTELAGGLSSEKTTPEDLAHWWTTLGDTDLNHLMECAVTSNLDLKKARSSIREARALRGISRAAFFPTLDGDASATRYRARERYRGEENELYKAGFDSGWELDIFGGTRRRVEASQADLEVTWENLHDVLVSLLAEVALNYVEVRTYQARLDQTRANIKSQRESYELNQSLYEAGIIDGLAVHQSLYNLERSRSHLSTLNVGLAAAKNRLAVLLGQRPGSLDLSETKPIPVLPPTVAVGVPAETLRHRPDIRRAERNLAARTARVGVATADLYPKFRLIGSIGLESVTSEDLLEWSSRTWSIGPAVSWNIFHGGAIRQNIKVQNERQEQALIDYETTVLNALEEVENILVAYAEEQQRMENLSRGADAAQNAVLLSEDQFQAGLVDFSNVLDAQRAQLNFQDELVRSKGAVISNLVRLYKALGGGWETADRPPAPHLRESQGK